MKYWLKFILVLMAIPTWAQEAEIETEVVTVNGIPNICDLTPPVGANQWLPGYHDGNWSCDYNAIGSRDSREGKAVEMRYSLLPGAASNAITQIDFPTSSTAYTLYPQGTSTLQALKIERGTFIWSRLFTTQGSTCTGNDSDFMLYYLGPHNNAEIATHGQSIGTITHDDNRLALYYNFPTKGLYTFYGEHDKMKSSGACGNGAKRSAVGYVLAAPKKPELKATGVGASNEVSGVGNLGGISICESGVDEVTLEATNVEGEGILIWYQKLNGIWQEMSRTTNLESTITRNANGIYGVAVEIDGIESFKSHVQIIERRPVPSFTFDQSQCFGHQVQFTNTTDESRLSDDEQAEVEYKWYFDDGNLHGLNATSTEKNPVFTYPKASTAANPYQVRLEIVKWKHEQCGERTGSYTTKELATLKDVRFTKTATCNGLTYAFTNQSATKYDAEEETYSWNYGNSPLSEVDKPVDYSPIYTYANESATYTVSLTGHYRAAGCPDIDHTYQEDIVLTDLTGDETFTFDTYTYNGLGEYDDNIILSVSTTTYSDTWLMTDQGLSNNPYLTGQQGIWRPASSYVFQTDRNNTRDIKQANGTDNLQNLAIEGGFNMDMFNWKAWGLQHKPTNDPRWIEASQITRINADGYAIEEKNALDLYSATIYGYDGQLVAASAANARYYELAYTGFEDRDGGNFHIRMSAEDQARVKVKTIPIIGAKNQTILIDMPYHELKSLLTSNPNFNVKGQLFDDATRSFMLDAVGLDCVVRNTANPNTTIAGLTDELARNLGKWSGALVYTETTDLTSIGVGSWYEITEEERHTGNKSLKLNYNRFKLNQEQLELQAGEQYVLSAWVKVVNPNWITPKGSYKTQNASMKERLGIRVAFGDESYELLIEPQGNIIEGWQKLEGVFTVPNNLDEPFSIYFQRDENESADLVYFDDLRLFPADGNMQSYVYDPTNFRLKATLDHNNYATLYSYDEEGNLYLIKKETTAGIKTIQESISHYRSSH